MASANILCLLPIVLSSCLTGPDRLSWLLFLSSVYGTCTVCLGLFPLPLGVFGRLCSLIVALPCHLYYSQYTVITLSISITKIHLFKYIETFTCKKWKLSDKKKTDIWRGGSNEYPQSMFLSRNKKNNVYPCKPQFYYIKVGFKEVKIK